MNLNIIYGPPGSGKTTAIQSLLNYRDFSYISIGEIYRKEIEKNTAFGEELRSYVESNIIYPEDVIRRIVEPYLLNAGEDDTIILDGFPKHEHELKVLSELLRRYPRDIQLGKIISMEINLNDALARMTQRFVCPVCDFHADSNDSCPRCGSSEMIKRNDDNDSEFIDRFQTYLKNNGSITPRLQKMGFKLTKINALNSKTVVRSLIDNTLFGQKEPENHAVFQSITGLNSKVISTIDHPYVSPPIRLLDSHRILCGIHSQLPVTILNWDVSQANARTYRYDMQIDLLFLGRSKSLFLFEDSLPFATQQPHPVSLSDYEHTLTQTLDQLTTSKKITDKQKFSTFKNYEVLKSKVLSTFINESGIMNDYTKRSLIALNTLLDRLDVANFIEERYLYYYSSPIMRQWIPYCFDNMIGKRSLLRVMEGGVFGRKILRNVGSNYSDDNLNDKYFLEDNLMEVTQLIRSGEIIPSIELLYWSMEHAGIMHFGNDYGFFERYSTYLNEELNNQLTSMSDDGKNLFVLDKDYGVSLDHVSGKLISKAVASSVKPTRINSAYAFYILLGDGMKIINTPEFTNYPMVVSLDYKLES